MSSDGEPMKPVHVRVREQAAQAPSLRSRINPPEGWRFVLAEKSEHTWNQLDSDGAKLEGCEVSKRWRLVIEAASIDTLELDPLPVQDGDIVHRPNDPVCPATSVVADKILLLTTTTMTRDGQIFEILEESPARGRRAVRRVTADACFVSDEAWLRDATQLFDEGESRARMWD